MAQLAQMAHQGKNGTCNTRSTKSRGYCFTLNNYTEEDIKNMTCVDAEYVFQEETGTNGTPHLQGFVYFKNAVGFNTVKKLHSKAHWEAAKKPRMACIRYCSKTDTRTGRIYHNLGDGYNFGTADTVKTDKNFFNLDSKKKLAEHMNSDEFLDDLKKLDLGFWFDQGNERYFL